MRFSIICGMALRDYWHERALSLCAVLALATVLAPLLILFGVRNGVISNLQERLLQDPRNLEIVPVGSGKYGKAFFEELRKRPDVGYVVPQTRAIAATIGLLPASEKKGGLSPNPVNVSLIPSGAGDPLTRRFAGSAALKDDEIILTAPAADKLGARAGTILTGRVTRARGMTREQAETPLRVKAVLPLSALQKEAAFVPPSLAEDAETYRDGMGVPERGWAGTARGDGERLYPSFRLYAGNLDGVASLRDFLGTRNIDVYTRAEEIENVKMLDRSTTLVFGLICLAAGVGFLASTASNLVAAIRRKRRVLGIIRLMGFSGADIVCFPLMQTLFTSALGMGLAFALYAAVAGVINALFPLGAELGAVCRLSWAHVGGTIGVVLALSLLAALPPSLSMIAAASWLSESKLLWRYIAPVSRSANFTFSEPSGLRATKRIFVFGWCFLIRSPMNIPVVPRPKITVRLKTSSVAILRASASEHFSRAITTRKLCALPKSSMRSS